MKGHMDDRFDTIEAMLKKISVWMGETESVREKQLKAIETRLDKMELDMLLMTSTMNRLSRPVDPKLVYVGTDPDIQELRKIVQKLRDDMGLSRRAVGYYPGAGGGGGVMSHTASTPRYEMRCQDPNCPACKEPPCPAPVPPRVTDQFAQFMQEDIKRRAYIYRYAQYPTARTMMAFTPVYFEMHADLYDTAEFLNLLAKIPRECII